MGSKVERFATCSVAGCGNPGVRGQSCTSCQRHLCAEHLAESLHHCTSSAELDDEAWEKGIDDEVSELLARVKIPALEAHAMALHQGMPCKFQPGKHLGSGAIMGCANYHGWLIFENGDRWLVRIPRDPFSDLPASLIEYLVVSEYATLKFLQGTSVPSPRVFGYGLASERRNDVGVSFILMEALPGKPFNAYQASLEQRERVYNGVADILIELSKHPLPKAGSLILKGDVEFEVGPTASNRFVALGLYGPFKSATEYFVSITEQYLDLIADGQLYPDYGVEAFLAYRFLEENLHQLASTKLEGQFYLKHVDDKGDHLLVDEQGNVTGIIDWQFARFVPACEAFGPSLFTADLDSLYSSNSGITPDDQRLAKKLRSKGADIIADFLEDNEMARRFHLGLASGMTGAEMWEMIKGLHAAFSSSPPSSLEDWKQDAIEKYGQDPRFVKLLQRQN